MHPEELKIRDQLRMNANSVRVGYELARTTYGRSIEDIALMTGIHKSSVETAIKDFEKLDLLEAPMKHGNDTWYKIKDDRARGILLEAYNLGAFPAKK